VVRELARIWFRAFSLVSLVALNTTQISGHHYYAAFITGSTLSWVWWKNTKTAASSDVRGAQLAYALGAGCGTVLGMLIGGLWNR
jgi:hypothetical protein